MSTPRRAEDGDTPTDAGLGVAARRAAAPPGPGDSTVPRHPDGGDAGREVEELTALLLEAATGLIAQGGGFLPFAARHRDGEAAELVPPVLDDDELESPDPGGVLDVLVEALRIDAGTGTLRCGGVCADVLVDLPEVGRVDAARVAVEHRDGPAAVTLLPYRPRVGSTPELLAAVRTPGDAVLFGE